MLNHTEPSASPLDAARSLFPLLVASSDAIEQQRCLPADVLAAMKASRLFRLCVPRRDAGLEASPVDMVEAIAEVARADGSAGWCLAIGATSGLVAAYLPEDEAATIYAADPTSVTGGVFAPRGQAVLEGDSYRMKGRWPFASGIAHCSWLMGGCVVLDGGRPVSMPNGMPDARMLLIPASQATVHDTWSVMGLCGTGSHDMEVDDVLVPRSRSVSLAVDKPRLDAPLYKFPVFGCLAVGIASVSLGLARRAIDELVELAGGKTPVGSRKRLADRGVVQVQVAEAESLQRGARALLLDTVAATYAQAERDGDIQLKQRALLRLAACHAVSQARRAVDLMHEAAGGTSIYRTSPLQRCLRDVHTATQHVMVGSATMELAGRVLCGIDTDASLL